MPLQATTDLSFWLVSHTIGVSVPHVQRGDVLQSGELAILIGAFWSPVYILCGAAKKGIIDLIY